MLIEFVCFVFSAVFDPISFFLNSRRLSPLLCVCRLSRRHPGRPPRLLSSAVSWTKERVVVVGGAAVLHID